MNNEHEATRELVEVETQRPHTPADPKNRQRNKGKAVRP